MVSRQRRGHRKGHHLQDHKKTNRRVLGFAPQHPWSQTSESKHEFHSVHSVTISYLQNELYSLDGYPGTTVSHEALLGILLRIWSGANHIHKSPFSTYPRIGFKKTKKTTVPPWKEKAYPYPRLGYNSHWQFGKTKTTVPPSKENGHWIHESLPFSLAILAKVFTQLWQFLSLFGLKKRRK